MLRMYSSYTQLDLKAVGCFLEMIPQGLRNAKWERIVDATQAAPDEPLPVDDIPDGNSDITSVYATVSARRGQGQFRDRLLQIWNGACAVTGVF